MGRNARKGLMRPRGLIFYSSQHFYVLLTRGAILILLPSFVFSKGVLAYEGQTWFHTDRTAGGHRHHSRANFPPLAGCPIGSRGGPAFPVCQQPEADCPSYA